MRPAPSTPSAELERQLDAYAASARANGSQRWQKNLLNASAYAAAAGSALAFATAAEAGIMYSGQGATATLLARKSGKTVLLPSASMAIPGLAAKLDVQLKSFTSASGKFLRAGKASLVGVGRGFKVFALSAIASLEKFNSGKKIPGFSTNTRAAVHARIAYPRAAGKLLGSRGSWTKPGQTGFAGFKFSKSTKMGVPQIVYGWIRLKWTDSPLLFPQFKGDPLTLTAIDYGYETVPGTPILAGAGVQFAPEPNSLLLALIATGATGVQLLRRNRQTRAGKNA